MRRQIISLVVVTWFGLWLATATHVRAGGAQQATASPDASAQASALLSRYCITCHNQRAGAGGLALDSSEITAVADHPDMWEKVVRKLLGGVMPPPGRPRPDQVAYDGLRSWLETQLDAAAVANPNPGRTETFHRLNRHEYANAVRDLFGMEFDIASSLPADDASYGFDNIAGALRISDSAMEQYLSVARRLVRLAVGAAPSGPVGQDFRIPPDQRQYEHVDGMPFGTRGGTLVRYTFPQDGEYEIEIEMLCDGAGCDGAAGFPDQHQLAISIDDEEVRRLTIDAQSKVRPEGETAYRVRVPVKAGPRDVGVAFIALPAIVEVDQLIARFIRPYFSYGSAGLRNYQPFVGRVSIKGPFQPTGPGDTPSRRRIFTCLPPNHNEGSCARTILSAMARRAYRRPVSNADLAPLLRFYEQGRADAGFERGIEVALRRLLVSPEFLFRVEHDPPRINAGTNYRVSDIDLASRLSFFVWSSIPDDQLIDLAERGRLKDPTVLQQQVRRMLADARSDAFVQNFAGQWLQLRNLEAAMPSLPLYPNFDEGLRRGFQKETELFFGSVLRENRSALDLLTANYTFVDERLARHYGIPNVYGPKFRRVDIPDANRRGLLGQGSILVVTSRPNRTSPVLRGKWILENLMGTAPPPPPPNIPALPERKLGSQAKVVSARERMAEHRANPACASCHSVIDPLGFALENFDAVGRWRDVDEAFKGIDASGTLPDGTRFDTFEGFRRALLDRPDRFARTLTEKLLTYALGRGLEAYDMPAVRRIVREAAPGGYKLSELVVGVTTSVPFQMRRSAAPITAIAEQRATPVPVTTR